MNIELKNGSKWPLNTAYNGDCLEFMKNLPDKCIDLVLTDPPYGINAGKDSRFGKDFRDNTSSSGKTYKAKDFKKSEWDSNIPDKIIFDEIMRISKHQIIWGWNYFSEHLKNTSSVIVWDKMNGESNLSDCELAWTSHDTAVRKYSLLWNGFQRGEKMDRIHPTQKPLKLFKWCLEKYSKPGDLIFDPFLGSFTTAVACHSHGLNWIGCEKDEDYFKAGTERYDTECLQGLLEF